jgi:hypothetical protein
MSYLPSTPKTVRYSNWGLRVLLGIGGGLQITTDDDALTPNRLNQWREARGRTVRE